MGYVFEFGIVLQYHEALLKGLFVTLQLSFWAIVLATLIGTIIALSRSFYPNSPFQKPLGVFVEFFRSIPVLVLMVWLFYAFPIITGIHFPAFETALLSLSLVSSAFIAEVLRAGLEAIPKGQLESAKLLGLSNFQTAVSIALPQAFYRNLPAIMGEYSSLIKLSPLAVILGVNELLHVTNTASILSYRPVEMYTVLGLLFLAIILPLSWLSKKLEFKNVFKTKS